MKKIRLVLLLIILFLLFSSRVQAHILQTDGTIGGVMHIEPEDDPIVGTESNILFEFKDKTGRFKPSECDCDFSIIENGKEIFTQPLFQNNTDPDSRNTAVSYTFPDRNIYEIKVAGQPKAGSSFQDFSLTYTVRVERMAKTKLSDQMHSNRMPFVYGGVIVILLMLFLGKLFLDKKNNTKPL